MPKTFQIEISDSEKAKLVNRIEQDIGVSINQGAFNQAVGAAPAN